MPVMMPWAMRVGSRRDSPVRAHPVVFVHRDQHEQARRQTDQHVSAQARGPAVERAFVADERARDEREQQPQDHLDVVFAEFHVP